MSLAPTTRVGPRPPSLTKDRGVRGLIALVAPALFSCGVADTGLLLCPPGTTSTQLGCEPVTGADAGPTDGSKPGLVRAEGAPVAFGRAAVGGVYEKRFTLVNDSPADVILTLEDADPTGAFTAGDLTAGSSIRVGSSARRPVTVRYAPRGGARQAFTFRFSCDGAGCPSLSVPVDGTPVREAFRCEGGDLGVARPGECIGAEVSCVNDTDYALPLLDAVIRDAPDFFASGPVGAVVAPGEPIGIFVEYCPSRPGRAVGTLELVAATSDQPNVSRTEVRARSGGEMGFLDCGRRFVELRAPVGGTDTEQVPCRVVGETTVFNLRFESPATPELRATLLLGGQPLPLPALVADGEPIFIQLTFAPSGPGRYMTRLNADFAGGSTGFPVVAAAEPMMGCVLDFDPMLDFGLVGLGQTAVRTTTVANFGPGPCAVEFLGMTAGSDPSFSVLEPPPGTGVVLQPGEALLARFLFAPQGAGLRAATYRFRAPTLMPEVQVVELRGVGGTQQVSCGDGMIDPGETCDDGNPFAYDACVECQPAACGDGFLQIGVEECDDGNLVSADPCDGACAWNAPGYAVSWVPSSTVSSLGMPISFPNQDDDEVSVPIGFGFEFVGMPVTVAHVGTNGLIGFGSPTGIRSFVNDPIPLTQDPNMYLAWWWADLITQAPGAMVTTALIGTAPNRVRSFTFTNLPGFGGNETPVVNARVDLFEGTNVIEVHYGDITVRNPSFDFDATVGFEGPGGLYGQDILGCTPNCSSVHWPSNTTLRYTPTF